MFFGNTTINYYDRFFTRFIAEHATPGDIPQDAAPNSYQGQVRVDEFLLMYAAHDIKLKTCAVDTQRVDNLLTFIRNYSIETADANCRLFFIKEQTDFIDSWFDGTEGNFETTEAIDTIVSKTEQTMNSYEFGGGYKIRVGKLENNIIVMSNRTIDRNRYNQIFLGLALIPMFYEQIREQLTIPELDLCKQMIRFTQLSRKPRQDLLTAVVNVEKQAYIQDIIYTLEKEQYFNMLKDTITAAPRSRLEHAKAAFDNAKQTYVETLNTLQRAEREYFAATNEDTQEVEEGIKTFLKHPNLIKIARDNGRLYAWFKTPLDIYDQDYVDCLLDKMPDNDHFKILWKELYEKEQGYFISSSIYCLIIDNDYGSRVQVLRDRPYENDRQEYKMGFNPHHFFFNCLGQFEVTINETLKSNNYAVLGDLLATCTRSINLADSAVLSRFKSYLNENPERFYVMYKDEVITAQEALKKIKLGGTHEENSD